MMNAIDVDHFAIQHVHKGCTTEMPEAHSHEQYRIFYCFQGEQFYSINGNSYLLQKGDMVLSNPNQTHRFPGTKMVETEKIALYFKKEFVGSLIAVYEERLLPFTRAVTIVRFSAKEQKGVERILKEMIIECRQQEKGYRNYIRLLLIELLIQISRISNINGESGRLEKRTHPMDMIIEDILAYLNEHFNEEVTLDLLAKKFYISASYLSRMFKRVSGLHFREYLQLLRINKAQSLLSNSQEKIVTISHMVGYEHVTHFNSTFKKISGVTPLHYRKMNSILDVTSR